MAITEKHESINDKAGDVMGGEVLEFEAKKIHDEGYVEGASAGEAKFALLATKLLELVRTDDLMRATEDIDYRNSLYEEFNL